MKSNCLFLSMRTESLEWTKKEGMVYFNFQKKIMRLELLRLNINDDYNFFIGDVNFLYQLGN